MATEIINFSIEHGDSNHSHVNLDQRVLTLEGLSGYAPFSVTGLTPSPGALKGS